MSEECRYCKAARTKARRGYEEWQFYYRLFGPSGTGQWAEGFWPYGSFIRSIAGRCKRHDDGRVLIRMAVVPNQERWV